MLQNFSFK